MNPEMKNTTDIDVDIDNSINSNEQAADALQVVHSVAPLDLVDHEPAIDNADALRQQPGEVLAVLAATKTTLSSLSGLTYAEHEAGAMSQATATFDASFSAIRREQIERRTVVYAYYTAFLRKYRMVIGGRQMQFTSSSAWALHMLHNRRELANLEINKKRINGIDFVRLVIVSATGVCELHEPPKLKKPTLAELSSAGMNSVITHHFVAPQTHENEAQEAQEPIAPPSPVAGKRSADELEAAIKRSRTTSTTPIVARDFQQSNSNAAARSPGPSSPQQRRSAEPAAASSSPPNLRKIDSANNDNNNNNIGDEIIAGNGQELLADLHAKAREYSAAIAGVVQHARRLEANISSQEEALVQMQHRQAELRQEVARVEAEIVAANDALEQDRCMLRQMKVEVAKSGSG